MPKGKVEESRKPAAREFELKLEVSRDVLDKLRKLKRLSGWNLGDPQASELRSVYFDTHDHRLRADGLSLRIRSEGGKRVQTVKCGTELANGVSHPIELESDIDGSNPNLDLVDDKKLRRRICELIEGSALVPVFETDIERTSRGLSKKKTTLELALDDGTIRAEAHELAICEAELELKSGSLHDMIAAAQALFGDHPFSFSNSSKAERGYELTFGRTESSPPPVGAEVPTFDEDATCRTVLAQLVQAAAGQITANRSVVLETDDPEGAHQMRVGLRRLRTALWAFGPLLGDTEQTLVDRAQALARLVGELRDADVLIQDICAPLTGSPHEAHGLPELQQVLAAHQRDKRDEVRTALRGTRWRALQLDLALWPQMLEENRLLDSSISDWAPQSLDRAWKKTAKRAKKIEELDVPKRHELRKALKKLRYSVEYFEQLYPAREVKPFTKQLEVLQDIFGYLNDAATAARIVEIARARSELNSAALEAAGFVGGWHTARAESCWKDAQAEWSKLKHQDRFWL